MHEIVRLGDLFDFKNGRSFKKEEWRDEGIPIIRIQNLNNPNASFNYFDGGYDESVEVNLGDLLFSWSGTVGTSFGPHIWKKGKGVLNQHIFKLSYKKNIDIKYAYYSLLQITGEIEKNVVGAVGIVHVTKKRLNDFTIPLPPLAEQQRIVAKLDAAFAEIDSAIFANACNITKANEIFSQYLSNVEADYLPLEKLINIKTGKLDSNAMVENGEFPFFTCSREIYSIDKFAFECDAVLLAGNNASGDFNVKHYEGKFNAYQRTYVLTVVDSNSLRSRYLYFQLINALSKFKRMSVGAGTKFLKIGMIRSLEIPLPPIIAQDKILEKLEKLLKLSEELHTAYNGKARQLSSLKSAILAQELKGETA